MTTEKAGNGSLRDQGSRYTSHDWQTSLKTHGLQSSMSRRVNCHDNTVADSFFQLLKRERLGSV
ncbi:DDE-type integrase/transposase/recombinase [Plesiomonas shigelloides]|uniref:DDE-type integrase/transposase/recombinase n=1 Tax=Plesiomonas shigelloides TaxID=703 RepID=A0A8I2B3E2_PLESH|nr:DDE-type integrase/transposase/recombinase [Plesiomonas shigelloides]